MSILVVRLFMQRTPFFQEHFVKYFYSFLRISCTERNIRTRTKITVAAMSIFWRVSWIVVMSKEHLHCMHYPFGPLGELVLLTEDSDRGNSVSIIHPRLRYTEPPDPPHCKTFINNSRCCCKVTRNLMRHLKRLFPCIT